MMGKHLFFIAFIALAVCCCTREGHGQWTKEQANGWYASQEWPIGCNYVPSYAMNQYEFWQEESFDIEVIEREMGFAQSIGFNTLRIFLHEALWYADKVGFKSRINQFLDIADKYGMKSIVTFFTNGGNHDFKFALGSQLESIPGLHNPYWIPSPGREALDDPSQWYKLKEYVQDILTTYKDDSRILYWCLCNEPENYKNGCDVSTFMPEVYKWAWEVRPSQPLSSPIRQLRATGENQTKLHIVSWLCEHNDIISFHCYDDDELEPFIEMLKPFGRPIICSEYMARPTSTFEHSLPIFKREKVGATNCGFMKGKRGLEMPWGSKAGDPEPEIWFHNIFNDDGTPFSESEIEFIKSQTAHKP